jgi:hypothetical protein
VDRYRGILAERRLSMAKERENTIAAGSATRCRLRSGVPAHLKFELVARPCVREIIRQQTILHTYPFTFCACFRFAIGHGGRFIRHRGIRSHHHHQGSRRSDSSRLLWRKCTIYLVLASNCILMESLRAGLLLQRLA